MRNLFTLVTVKLKQQKLRKIHRHKHSRKTWWVSPYLILSQLGMRHACGVWPLPASRLHYLAIKHRNLVSKELHHQCLIEPSLLQPHIEEPSLLARSQSRIDDFFLVGSTSSTAAMCKRHNFSKAILEYYLSSNKPELYNISEKPVLN